MKEPFMKELIFTPSDFVAVLNQTLETAYSNVMIEGELANLRISRNKWVHFDLKDEHSNVRFFGTVYNLPGPLEDGLMLRVYGSPRLHPLYGFNINIISIQPVGEGSIKKAAALLEAKLSKEGLFDQARKRLLPYPPKRVGLVTSSGSAAYSDFIKIINTRWVGLDIALADVAVQGETAAEQIIDALNYFNTNQEPVDVIVITRGGGSPEDLGAFSTEQVTRAIAGSRLPTLVAVGHESDVSLAELAADKRASTPSNAAELLVPDKLNQINKITDCKTSLARYILGAYDDNLRDVNQGRIKLLQSIESTYKHFSHQLIGKRQLLSALSPQAALKRGYAIVRYQGRAVKKVSDLKSGRQVNLQVANGSRDAIIK